MAILKIAKLGHPVLLKKTNEISDLNRYWSKKNYLWHVWNNDRCKWHWFAAPQVHLSHRLFIYRNPDIEEEEKINSFYFNKSSNWKISDDTEDDWEGCLSIPGMSGLVRRSKKLNILDLIWNGKNISGEAEGLACKSNTTWVWSLNGILYTSRLAHKNAFGYSEEIEKFWKKNSWRKLIIIILLKKRLNILKLAKIFISEEGLNSDSFENIASKSIK